MQFLVLGGGNTPERDVSLSSAAAVQEALIQLGHSVTFLDTKEADPSEVQQTASAVDAVFPILHGKGGEDGTIQSLLASTGTPYFGSEAAASAITFNKVTFKQKLLEAGVLTPSFEVLSADTFKDADIITRPFVLKPIEGGSSIDTFIIRQPSGPNAAMHEALITHGTMLVEELIDGAEVTVGVLGDSALPVIEIIPPTGGEFDYENKYNGRTKELCPPKNVSLQLQQQAQDLALQVHQVMGCRHVSRTDIMISRSEKLYVIDTNIIPGMTKQSLLPKAAHAAGLDWPSLVAKFVELTLSK